MWSDCLQIYTTRIYDSLVHIGTIRFEENKLSFFYIIERLNTGVEGAQTWNVKA